MATAIPAQTEYPTADRDQCVVMWSVGWEGYKFVLRARGDGRRPKMVYLDGDLYLMSPAYKHEEFADRISDLVKAVCVELGLPCTSMRSTTFRRKTRNGGAEADASFYLANAERIRGRTELSLRRDPPPDLAIEAVNTHGADTAVEVWRRFGVPEVWVADALRVRIMTLQADGQYAESANSAAFPFLSAAEIFGWMTRDVGGTDTDWLRAMRAWVRDVLAPRARGGE